MLAERMHYRRPIQSWSNIPSESAGGASRAPITGKGKGQIDAFPISAVGGGGDYGVPIICISPERCDDSVWIRQRQIPKLSNEVLLATVIKPRSSFADTAQVNRCGL